MKRIVLILTALLISAGTAGCSAVKQVHDKKYLRAVSISGDESKNAVFAFYTEDSKPVSAAGESIADACKSAELKCGKDIFTGHTELIILGSCDYRETLEFLLNEWKVSPSCLVTYCGEDGAKLLENNDAERLADSVRAAQEQGKAPECDIVTVLSEILSGSAEVAELGNDGVSGVYTIK